MGFFKKVKLWWKIHVVPGRNGRMEQLEKKLKEVVANQEESHAIFTARITELAKKVEELEVKLKESGQTKEMNGTVAETIAELQEDLQGVKESDLEREEVKAPFSGQTKEMKGTDAGTITELQEDLQGVKESDLEREEVKATFSDQIKEMKGTVAETITELQEDLQGVKESDLDGEEVKAIFSGQTKEIKDTVAEDITEPQEDSQGAFTEWKHLGNDPFLEKLKNQAREDENGEPNSIKESRNAKNGSRKSPIRLTILAPNSRPPTSFLHPPRQFHAVFVRTHV